MQSISFDGRRSARVDIVRPGGAPSELRGSTEAQQPETLKERLPRIQPPAEVGNGTAAASIVAFLVSGDAAWIPGAAVDVDRGYALGAS